jgi:hypothetical protein
MTPAILPLSSQTTTRLWRESFSSLCGVDQQGVGCNRNEAIPNCW